MSRSNKCFINMMLIAIIIGGFSLWINYNIQNITEKKADINIYDNIDYTHVYNYEYYIHEYPEISEKLNYNRKDILEYFVKYGTQVGQQGCEWFNVNSYKNTYQDLRQQYGSDLYQYYKHYIYEGYYEGREAIGNENEYNENDYLLVYNYEYYIKQYPELAEQFNYDRYYLLEYFIEYGMQQGQQAIENFNVYIYKERYEDLYNIYHENLKKYYEHYIKYGYKEGRNAI